MKSLGRHWLTFVLFYYPQFSYILSTHKYKSYLIQRSRYYSRLKLELHMICVCIGLCKLWNKLFGSKFYLYCVLTFYCSLQNVLREVNGVLAYLCLIMIDGPLFLSFHIISTWNKERCHFRWKRIILPILEIGYHKMLNAGIISKLYFANENRILWYGIVAVVVNHTIIHPHCQEPFPYCVCSYTLTSNTNVVNTITSSTKVS